MNPSLINAVKLRLGRPVFIVVFSLLMLTVSAQTSAQETTEAETAQPEGAALSDLDLVGKSWFERLDRNQDGQLSEEEFRAGYPSTRLGVIYQHLPERFRESDRNQNGFLEADEYAELPIIIHAGSDAPTLASVDSSHDDRLDFREFVVMMAELDGAIP